MKSKKRKTYRKRNQKIRLMLLNLITIVSFVLLITLILNILIPITRDKFGSYSSDKLYQIKMSDEQMIALPTTDADSIYRYGETINIDGDNLGTDYNINLFDTATNTNTGTIEVTTDIDVGVNANDLPVGSYFLELDDQTYISYGAELDLEFNTITRDGVNNHIIVNTVNNLVHITKYRADKNNDELDILIDAGHGGNDPGSSSTDGMVLEKDLNLQLATLIANKLSDLGYNVGLTRTEDVNPGTCEDNISSYCSDGRVSMAYAQNAKLVLSIHHNTGGASGYEVYTSNYATEELATIVADQLADVSQPSTKQTGYVSDGVYQETFEDDDYPGITQDYMYMIRETGGIATHSVTEENQSQNTLPQGAQGLLVEFGYLDNDSDLLHVTDDDVIEQEATAVVTAVDDYLQNRTSTLNVETTSES